LDPVLLHDFHFLPIHERASGKRAHWGQVILLSSRLTEFLGLTLECLQQDAAQIAEV